MSRLTMFKPGLLAFKGATDASGNPNYPSALTGDYYVISVDGKIGGASGKDVVAGDFVVAVANNAGGAEGSVGTSWIVIANALTGVTSAGLAILQAISAAAQTALLSTFVGDSGSGGTKGLVPAPGAGAAAAGKFLKADGTFAVPAGGGSSAVQPPQIVTKKDTEAIAGDDDWHDVPGLTGLEVELTSDTQTVEIILHVMAVVTNSYTCALRIVRDSTPVGIGDAAGNRIQATVGHFSGGVQQAFAPSAIIHDAPGAADTYTYKVQYLVETGGTIYINRDIQDSNSGDLGVRGVSSLRAMVFEPA